MSSKRERILEKIKDVLEAIPGNTGHVYRSRKNPTSRKEGVVLIIEPGPCLPDTNQTRVTDWTLTVNILLHVRGEVPDSVADEPINLIHAALMLDSSLGGLANEIVPLSHNFEFYDSDSNTGIFPLAYAVNYRTNYNDLTT